MIRKPKVAALWLLLVLFPVFVACAQEAEEPVFQGGEGSAVSQEGNVNLDFRDADIHNVLRILSYKSN